MTVEAAIILPIFIIALLTIGYTIRNIGASENVMHVMCDEARLIQTYAYDIRLGAAYPPKIENRMDGLSEIDGFEVDEFDYLFDDGHVRLDGTFDVVNRMPIRLHDSFHLKEGVLFRGFVPHDNSGDIYSFDRMQLEDDDSTVYVFPVAGERYHDFDCSFIQNDPIQQILTGEIRKKYSPCRLCRPDEYADGHVVYVFRTGNVYHSGDCYIVDRYVVPMVKRKAVEQGYSPCRKCGG